ncbi:hypothetical protein MOC54_22110, partial [Bacillus spizizenii]|nr:hypothetical protein [Bacillus spizizenii]
KQQAQFSSFHFPPYRIRYVKPKLQRHYTNNGTPVQSSLQNLKTNKHNLYNCSATQLNECIASLHSTVSQQPFRLFDFHVSSLYNILKPEKG